MLINLKRMCKAVTNKHKKLLIDKNTNQDNRSGPWNKPTQTTVTILQPADANDLKDLLKTQ